MNARRYPRTLQEAFGPHTSTRIEEKRQTVPLHEKALYVLAVVSVLVVIWGA